MFKSAPKNNFSIAQALAAFDIAIEAVACGEMTNDSRKIKSGDIFCAVIGDALDGRQYIDKAIEQGAALVIAQCQHIQQHGKLLLKKGIVIVQFYELDKNLFTLAEQYYQLPQKSLTVVGITGTNGKTSIALMVAKLLETCQQKAAVIGTLGAGQLANLLPLANTTPAATEVMSLLNGFKAKKIAVVTMEVSSHALVQKRVLPELFDIALFNNLSRDHLDYHQTMENYAAAKFSLFNSEKPQQIIVNGDDEYAQQWLAALTAEKRNAVVIYGKAPKTLELYNRHSAYVFAQNLTHHGVGITFEVVTAQGKALIESPLLGDFNVENLLAAMAILLSLSVPLADIQQAIKSLTPAIGRMEAFTGTGKVLSVVDYAHTPDGLKNALLAVKQHCQGELWVVFGCGGDRDKGKRAEMGAIAEQLAEHVIVTNDNPRTEPAEMIASDILSGCQQLERITIILNRQQAACSALAHAKPNDAILFAGKGHEEYIIIGADKIPYNERALVKAHYQKAVL
ncbi:MAG: UDP-N-acetylmuramoyl-L-alanyl-D-glutamate--2,6-diaminopimelate ligase [Thalassotalea sp.]